MSVTSEEVSGPSTIGGGGVNSTNTPATTTTGSAPGSSSVSSNAVSASSATSSAPTNTTAADTIATTAAINSNGESQQSYRQVNGQSNHFRHSSGGHKVSPQTHGEGRDDVVKSGNLRKLKGKKKFFVLRKETEGKPARLEYYASEKKFNLNHPPKKSIVLKHCFNINRTESKVKYAVALHTHNDCVRIAFSSEEEMNEWLRLMNSLCGDEDEPEENPAGQPAKPFFEHVWLVQAFNKGLGSQLGILGSYRLCLTSKELTLLKVGDPEEKNSELKFPLPVIRNVSHDAIGCFHIEFGRMACTGTGKLSLKTEDNNIAQNMHLLILKAMQNYQKDDIIPRENSVRTGRTRTATWSQNDDTSSSYSARSGSFRSTPPGMPRIRSVDSSISRLRAESVSSTTTTTTSTSTERRMSGMSPPVPVPPTPPNAYKSIISSTDSANSASSSYSMDYENNNNNNNNNINDSNSSGGGSSVHGHHHHHQHGYSKSQDEDDSYVPWNPGEEMMMMSGHHHNGSGGLYNHHQHHNLSLALQSDTSDYVETSVGTGVNGTPSSNAEMQSPLSPYDNYMPMSPAGAIVVGVSGSGSIRSGGKLSVSHSRNSSLIEDHDGYVPMIPGGGHHHSHSRSESGACSTAGSTTGLDDSYLDMDFSRKLNLSNDDMRHMSPVSSESIQSGTPSSDCQLEKVSSYFQNDDFDDGSIALRPVRAYSVGSRSDTGSAGGKSRFGKHRLEAVQEAHRTRAMSVGSKQPPRRPSVNPSPTMGSGLAGAASSAIYNAISSSRTSTGSGAAPLSSSWSGSTGRWLPPKIYPAASGGSGAQSTSPSYHPNPLVSHHHAQDSGDSDLMELDFSHNKQKSRKRSLPGPGSTLSSSSSAGSGGPGKLSPCARALISSGSETPPALDTPPEPLSKSTSLHLALGGSAGQGSPAPRYPTSAPISIQKSGSLSGSAKGLDCTGGYVDSSNSILKRMTGLDLKKLKELDDDGAYLAMDFTGAPAPALPPGNGSLAAAQPSRVPPVVAPIVEGPPVMTSAKPPYGAPGTRTSSSSDPLSSQTPVVIRANERVTPAKFTFSNSSGGLNNSTTTTDGPSLSRSLSCSSNISTTSNNSNSSSASCVSVKSSHNNNVNLNNNNNNQAPCSPDRPQVPLTLNIPPPTPTATTCATGSLAATSPTPPAGPTSSTLSRIEESPEKLGSHYLHNNPAYVPMAPSSSSSSSSSSTVAQTRLPFNQPGKKGSGQDDGQVTYTSIQHFAAPSATSSSSSSSATTTSLPRHFSFPSDLSRKLLSSTSRNTAGSTTTTTTNNHHNSILNSCGKQSLTSPVPAKLTNGCSSSSSTSGKSIVGSGSSSSSSNSGKIGGSTSSQHPVVKAGPINLARVTYAQVEFVKNSQDVKRN